MWYTIYIPPIRYNRCNDTDVHLSSSRNASILGSPIVWYSMASAFFIYSKTTVVFVTVGKFSNHFQVENFFYKFW